MYDSANATQLHLSRNEIAELFYQVYLALARHGRLQSCLCSHLGLRQAKYCRTYLITCVTELPHFPSLPNRATFSVSAFSVVPNIRWGDIGRRQWTRCGCFVVVRASFSRWSLTAVMCRSAICHWRSTTTGQSKVKSTKPTWHYLTASSPSRTEATPTSVEFIHCSSSTRKSASDYNGNLDQIRNMSSVSAPFCDCETVKKPLYAVHTSLQSLLSAMLLICSLLHYSTFKFKVKKMPKHFRHFTNTVTIYKLRKRRQE